MTIWLLLVLLFVPQTMAFGRFEVSKSTDPLDDTVTTMIGTGGESTKTALVWRCGTKDSAPVVAFFFGRYFTGGQTRQVYVEHRFVPDKAEIAGWTIAGQNRDFVLMPADMIAAFTKRARTADTLVMRVTDIDGESVTDTFKMTGLPEALSKLPCRAE